MPPIIFELAAKYGSRALAILLLLVSVVAGYYYWKHNITLEATNKAIEKCNESKEKFRIDADDLRREIQEKVNKLNSAQEERVKNAVQIYHDHYESQLNARPIASVRIKTSSTGSCGNGLPGTGESKSSTAEGIAGTGQAELPERNRERLESVIYDIDNKLKLKCEQLLNSLP